MLKIAWRNPQPPVRRKLRIAEVRADESTSAPVWLIIYQTIIASGWPENEYHLLVNRHFERGIAV
jgi:hypothetical protein